MARFQGPFESVAWSPTGDRTALASFRGSLAIGTGDRITRQVAAERTADEGRLRVLGWPDDSGFVVLDGAGSALSGVSADLEDTEALVRADGVADLDQLPVATDLLAEPPRTMPAPEWPSDLESPGWRVALAVGALLAGAALVVSLRRRS